MKKFSVGWMLGSVLLPCDFGCDICYRPEDLRILDGELTCQTCFDDAFFHSEDAPDWWDLEELPDLCSIYTFVQPPLYLERIKDD